MYTIMFAAAASVRTDINSWVEAVASVHEEVGSQDGKVARQSVHFHLTAPSAVAEVVVQVPLASAGFKGQSGRGVEALS